MIAIAEPRGNLYRAKALPRAIMQIRGCIIVERVTADELSLSQIAENIRTLVETGRVEAARAELAKLEPERLARPPFSGWARALSLPKVRLGLPGHSNSADADAAWVRDHGHAYANEWVALRDGVLIGHHVNQVELRRDLEARGELHGVLFICLRNG